MDMCNKPIVYFLLISLAFLLSKNANSENKLLLCSNYDKEGNYSNAFETWSIEKKGNYIYIFYQSDSITSDTVFFSLHKTVGRRDTNFYPYDNYFMLKDSSGKFAVNKFVFTDAGKYKISAFYRNSKQALATHFTTVFFKYEEYANSLFYDTWYYHRTSVLFCDSINNNQAIGVRNQFSYSLNGNIITAFIKQEGEIPLRTDLLYVKVFSTGSVNRLILTKTFFISREWYWTFVPVQLTEKGNYLVEIYDENEVFINSNTFEIK